MKYLLLLLLIVTSCPRKHCYQCTEIEKPSKYSDVSTTTKKYCDWTENDATKYEVRTSYNRGDAYRRVVCNKSN